MSTVEERNGKQLRALAADARAAVILDYSIHSAVMVLRSRGVSWSKIAAELGVTRQAAQQRFGKDVLR